MILAVDVGGTNTRAAWFENGDLPRPLRTRTEATYKVVSFESWLRALLGEEPRVEAVCVGVAGPVFGGRSFTVNLPWSVDAQELSRGLGSIPVWVINDLEAAAYAVEELRPEQWAELCPCRTQLPSGPGNRAVIAAGTGLGEAGLCWNGTEFQPFATEGGHASFAPIDDFDVELLRWLWKRFDHVSWERVLSGPGIKNIYDFLLERSAQEPRTVFNTAEEIASAAAAGKCALSVAAMHRFARFYGAEAANLALKTMATGGVYVVGTMAVKNRMFLDSDHFREAFWGKGRMRPLLEAIPVRLVLLEDLGLLGAAVCARRRLRQLRVA